MLRFALAVAVKLNANEFERWIRSEMDGYNDKDSVPSYRTVVGQLKSKNPYSGWIPVMFQDQFDVERIITTLEIRQPVSELEALVASSGDGSLVSMLSAERLATMQKSTSTSWEMGVFIGAPKIIQILDAVRNSILDWSLKLEAAGVMGSGLLFSSAEKEKAATVHIENVGTFMGVVGDTQGHVQFSHNNANHLTGAQLEEIRELVSQIASYAPQVKLDGASSAALEETIASLRNELGRPEPSQSIVQSGLRRVKPLVENVAANLIASGIATQIGRYIG